MSIINLLASDNFIIYNKEFAKRYGVDEAILLGVMCSYQRSFNNEWFYREQDKILEDTALKLYSLRTATKTLNNLGILEIIKMGMPAKSYYKINEEQLQKCLMSRTIENDRSSSVENDRSSSVENNTTINNNNNNNNNKNNNVYSGIINENIQNDSLKNTIYEFIKMRKLIKKPLTEFALKKIINKLFRLSNNVDEQILILEQSITHNWQDIYELKKSSLNDKHSYSKEELNEIFNTKNENIFDF